MVSVRIRELLRRFFFYFSLLLFWWRFNKTITPLSLVVVAVSFYILAGVSLKAGYRRYTAVFVVTNLPLTAGL